MPYTQSMVQIATARQRWIFLEEWFDLFNFASAELDKVRYPTLEAFLLTTGLTQDTLNDNLFIAWAADMPVGYLLADGNRIMDLWVAPLFRRQKTATGLLEHFLAERAGEKLSATTEEKGFAAEIFKGMGWQRKGVIQHWGKNTRLSRASDLFHGTSLNLKSIPFQGSHQPHWRAQIETWGESRIWKSVYDATDLLTRGQALLVEGEFVGGAFFRNVVDFSSLIEHLPLEKPSRILEILVVGLNPRYESLKSYLIESLAEQAHETQVPLARMILVKSARSTEQWKSLGWILEKQELVWSYGSLPIRSAQRSASAIKAANNNSP